jgi:hypothetical protein
MPISNASLQTIKMQSYFLSILICLTHLFICNICDAQKFELTKLGATTLNQSLYDVVKVTDSTCYAVGEFGARAKINFNQNICAYETDANKKTIVELLDAFGLNAIPFEIETDSNRTQYANYFFNGEQYTSCFDARILIPKAVVPHTVIYKRGKFKTDTLQKMYGSVVWQFLKQKGQLFALKYNMFGTKLYCVSNSNYKSKRFKSLLHKSFVLNDTAVLLCGATNFKLRNGVIDSAGTQFKFKHKGMIWDVAMANGTIIGAGSKGKIFIKYPNSSNFEIIETGEPYHFYDICVVGLKTFILVGQGGIVYRLYLKD